VYVHTDGRRVDDESIEGISDRQTDDSLTRRKEKGLRMMLCFGPVYGVCVCVSIGWRLRETVGPFGTRTTTRTRGASFWFWASGHQPTSGGGGDKQQQQPTTTTTTKPMKPRRAPASQADGCDVCMQMCVCWRQGRFRPRVKSNRMPQSMCVFSKARLLKSIDRFSSTSLETPIHVHVVSKPPYHIRWPHMITNTSTNTTNPGRLASARQSIDQRPDRPIRCGSERCVVVVCGCLISVVRSNPSNPIIIRTIGYFESDGVCREREAWLRKD
jgi:hypothetical protein